MSLSSLQSFSVPDATRRRRRFGVVCVLGYVVLSWAMRFDMRRGDQIASLIYPLDTFSMYAQPAPNEMHHVLVRDATGGVHRVTAFRSFACAEPVRGEGVRCTDRRGYQYHYDDLAEYIASHSGAGDVDVELISRTWRVEAGAAPLHTGDCVIAHCKVSR